MTDNTPLIPVGARVLIRDAEWRVTAVDPVREGGWRLKCTGLSQLVRGRQAVFLTVYEGEITVLRPEEAALVEDTSAGFEKTKLYLEALIRTAPLTDDRKICVAHHAAMDPMPYQFNPALQALSQPRARILIADAVGIGKTLEAGILVSELMARGRGKRILVLATKAVLPQFQKEFWNRFSIPLTRLDSAGIQRVRNRIPSNHNPFHYFDRTIISIDTLKNDLQYRQHLESARWDIIVIDEAHNVADRGSGSQRASLAKLLADRSDTMILLSATPHDGRSESFASLLNILDPTAIANPSNYTPEDFAEKGLVIRRFKNDIRSQVQAEFPDRKIRTELAAATAAENAVYDLLSTLTFKTLDQKKATGARLFATTLTKAMFSSPQACASVIEHRLANLRKKGNADATEDIAKLESLLALVNAVKPEDFSKLTLLTKLLGDGDGSIGWTRRTEDRLVVFTESVKTLKFLEAELPKRLKLKKDEYLTLSGEMKDNEIKQRVDDFNNGSAAVRLLLCSDVASEGLNLHHFAHRMIHFDIPWSLLTFQQRNGRIDRYGQRRQPEIVYLQTQASDEAASNDARVLQRLQEKDQRAQTNLDDPAEFFLTQKEQEDRTAAEMEGHLEAEEHDAADVLTSLLGIDFSGDDTAATLAPDEAEEVKSLKRLVSPVLTPDEYRQTVTERGLLYDSAMSFGEAALSWLAGEERWPAETYRRDSSHRFLLKPPEDLVARLKYLPVEVLPESGQFDLTDDAKVIQDEMRYTTVSGEEWPAKQLFGALHPVMKWLEDRLQNVFGRHSAPVVPLTTLAGERWALLQGGYPNRRGYIPVHRWVAVREKAGELTVHSLGDLIGMLKLNDRLTNTGALVTPGVFKGFIAEAVKLAGAELARAKTDFEGTALAKLKQQTDELEVLKNRHMAQLELDFGDDTDSRRRKAKNDRKLVIERHFESARSYMEGTAQLENEPYLQLVAVFCPAAC